MTTIAIIPARGGSKGLKRKNIKPLLENPLIAYTIEAAIHSDIFDHVIVSTEDQEIADIAKKYGAKVPFLRPEELATDTASSIDVMKHAIEMVEEVFHEEVTNVVLLQPTSPLRTAFDIRSAFNTFLEFEKTPVVSVCEARTHPFLLKELKDHYLINFIEKPKEITRRQDFPLLYELNGAIYITTSDMVTQEGVIYKDKVLPYVMSKENSVDIDDEIDFLLAETILAKRSENDNENRK